MSKKQFIVKPSHYGNCVHLAGNATAGGFLYRIYCRSNKSTFKDKDGEKGWAVLTRNEWMVDLGYTRNQYNYALKRLKDKRLLIWKNKHKGLPVGGAPLWVKLSEEIIQKIQDTESHIHDSYNSKITTQVEGRSREIQTPIYKCEKKINVNTKMCISSDKESLDGDNGQNHNKKDLRKDKNIKDDNVIYINKDKNMKKGGGKGMDVTRSKRRKNIQEVVKEFKSKKPRATVKGIRTFHFLWQELYSEYFSDIELLGWSGKEQGFAISLLRKIDDLKDPNVKLSEVLRAVFENWEEYAEFACAQRGQDRLPYSPNIGFIAGGFQDLMIWYNQRDEDVHTSAQPEDSRKGYKSERRKIKTTDSKIFTRGGKGTA